MRFVLFGLLALFTGFDAAHLAAQSPAPYKGQQAREIKALSAEDIQSLLKGEGMGLAKAAELNLFPGPLHVLQLTGDLSLSERQKGEVQGVFDRMKTRAVALGRRIVELERELDRAFATRSIEARSLERQVAEISRLQGELRSVHLAAHLETLPLLTPHQARRYAELRGYLDGPSAPEQFPGHGHGMKH